ncbi:MAG: hypothetical protein NTX25_23955 [Proteobacteria bacterium]|nr:hypothetical protein [Pseudomonadota bacterium]
MIQVNFKNMDRSELAKDASIERLETVIERFPDLRDSVIAVNLQVLNSPIHAGPDLFSVTLHIKTGRYRGIQLGKSAPNLYIALAEVIDRMLEKLNRFGDRSRVKSRNQAREFVSTLKKAKVAKPNESTPWDLELDQEAQQMDELPIWFKTPSVKDLAVESINQQILPLQDPSGTVQDNYEHSRLKQRMAR